MATNGREQSSQKNYDKQFAKGVSAVGKSIGGTYDDYIAHKKRDAQKSEQRVEAANAEWSYAQSRVNSSVAALDARHAAGTNEMTAEEYALVRSKSGASMTENYKDGKMTGFEIETADAESVANSILGVSERKRRAEYYSNLASAQSKGVSTGTKKVAGQSGSSILSPKKSNNLLGL